MAHHCHYIHTSTNCEVICGRIVSEVQQMARVDASNNIDKDAIVKVIESKRTIVNAYFDAMVKSVRPVAPEN